LDEKIQYLPCMVIGKQINLKKVAHMGFGPLDGMETKSSLVITNNSLVTPRGAQPPTLE